MECSQAVANQDHQVYDHIASHRRLGVPWQKSLSTLGTGSHADDKEDSSGPQTSDLLDEKDGRILYDIPWDAQEFYADIEFRLPDDE